MFTYVVHLHLNESGRAACESRDNSRVLDAIFAHCRSHRQVGRVQYECGHVDLHNHIRSNSAGGHNDVRPAIGRKCECLLFCITSIKRS